MIVKSMFEGVVVTGMGSKVENLIEQVKCYCSLITLNENLVESSSNSSRLKD